MTYLTFHLLLILPLIALFAVLPRPDVEHLPRRGWPALLGVALIAFVYTSLWDNYLVYRGVWGYGSDRVLGTLGYVPVEEYAFFILQPFLTGLWYYHLRARLRPSTTAAPSRFRVIAVAFWLAVAMVGLFLLAHPDDHLLYLGLILAWCAPVLAGMSVLGFGHTWADGRAAALGIAVPTVYLWIADGFAIRVGIWSITPRYSIPLAVLGLPIEEAVFFLVTNVMVVQGLTLFLPERGAARPVPSPHERLPIAR